MRPAAIVYDDLMLKHEPPAWHPEGGSRILRILETLERSSLLGRLLLIKPRSASFKDVALVHTPDYIEMIRSFSGECLDEDTFFSAGTLDAALCAAGSVLEAVDSCRRGNVARVFCAVRPPGHHAEPDKGMGFCIFNNVAIGARYAQKVGYERVFIIDFDAHHGNGTQRIFEESDTVFFFSTHQHPYYPETGRDTERGKGKGEGFTYNIPIRKGSGNKDYLYVYQDILPGLVSRFAPDIILVSAGYDIHADDPHADIRVTGEGVRGIVRSIVSSAPCATVFVLEGGYNPEALGESVKITIEEMLRL